VACTAPSWRSDIYREVDLIEEVTRVHGYDQIPTEPRIQIEVVGVDARQKLTQSITTLLGGCGFYETITVGFVDRSVARLFTAQDVDEHLAVTDVTRKSANLLRQSLLGSLLGVLKTNVNANNLPCRIFEIADTFVPSGKENSLPTEKTKVALVCDGDLRDLRGVIEGLVKSFDRDAEIVLKPADVLWAKTGAEIAVNGEVLGAAGVVSQAVTDKFDFKTIAPVAAELEFERLSALQSGPRAVKPIPRFPAVERDLSVVVDEQVAWADIAGAVDEKAPGELEDIRFVDIYRGKGIAAGKKSVTLSLRFRDEDGTLTHDTVDGFEKSIVQSLANRVQAELRTI
jgi:phenylalanyl-tRNA synthetase beta chain